jgi:membrane protease YdiL (CAAX protease family)
MLLGGAALVGVGLAPWVNLVTTIQHQYWPQDPASQKQMLDLLLPALMQHPILTIVLVGALAGVCEELFYRGPVQTALVRRSPAWFGITIAAFLFAAVHMDLYGLPVRFALGLLLGWIAWRGQSIYPAMLAHGLYDSTQLAMAAWQIRSVGLARAVEESTRPTFALTPSDVTGLAVGGAMIAIGLLLCRSVFAKRPPAPADGTIIAAQPA